MSEEKKAQIAEKRASFKSLYEQLSAPFPQEAYTRDDSRGFALTSLKPQYIVERLNEVCGVDGWELVGEFTRGDGDVLFTGKLVINDGFTGHGQIAVGAALIKKSLSDAYKSAKTDALSKAASYFGVGNDMFKGLVEPPAKGGAAKPKATMRSVKPASGSDF